MQLDKVRSAYTSRVAELLKPRELAPEYALDACVCWSTINFTSENFRPTTDGKFSSVGTRGVEEKQSDRKTEVVAVMARGRAGTIVLGRSRPGAESRLVAKAMVVILFHLLKFVGNSDV